MEIKSQNLIALLFLPMNNIKIIQAINQLGLEQPLVTEESIEQNLVTTINDNIGFTFKELNGFSQNGELLLVKIEFLTNSLLNFPYNLKYVDNYEASCTKLGRKADFRHKWLKKSRLWLFTTHSNKNYNLAVHYTNKELDNIKNIVVNYLDEDNLGTILIPNQD